MKRNKLRNPGDLIERRCPSPEMTPMQTTLMQEKQTAATADDAGKSSDRLQRTPNAISTQNIPKTTAYS